MLDDPKPWHAYLENMVGTKDLTVDNTILDNVVQLSTHLLHCADSPCWQPVALWLEKFAKRLKHLDQPTSLSETLLIVIYHHRGLRYEADLKYDQATVYYQKALRRKGHEGLGNRVQQMAQSSLTGLTQAQRSLYSSEGSEIEHICAGCGVEAERMPVCARCKRVRLCTAACVRHSDHRKVCKKRVTFA
ncbi:hypothetical protein INT43_008353 [Umbelopsis isabellina]|uniref:MYND-type domain-containing protein n=1 Tax=Mortierella isabellina TaxID=91625 RepID=A0A8H7PCY7_MORIS|nr:hypothetical protein INT43_008353 [Umbelopsis isabellina]